MRAAPKRRSSGAMSKVLSRPLGRTFGPAVGTPVTSYRSYDALVGDPAVEAVYISLANDAHREWSQAALAAGKHVLCEKPVAPTVADAEAMAEAAGKSGRVAAVGFTFRRSPAVNAIREQITGGSLGKVMHFNGHYWCDYGFSKDAPMSWRYKGGPGSGALLDIGGHLVDLGEFLCGPLRLVPARPTPATELAVTVRHSRQGSNDSP